MGTIDWAASTRYSNHLNIVTSYEEQLLQLFYGVTWDGDLINKTERTNAVKAGHAVKSWGWNIITQEGVKFLVDTGAVVA
ncbi:MAG: hypothetical protein GY938_27000 [Ketobacter sp.]|nr:hypothetical protein [Ketobacter sp.]